VLIGAVAAKFGMRSGIGVIAAAATLAALFSLRLKKEIAYRLATCIEPSTWRGSIGVSPWLPRRTSK